MSTMKWLYGSVVLAALCHAAPCQGGPASFSTSHLTFGVGFPAICKNMVVAQLDYDAGNLVDTISANPGADNLLYSFQDPTQCGSTPCYWSGAPVPGPGWQICWVAVGDVNNDTFNDLVVLTIEPRLEVALNDGIGTFGLSTTYIDSPMLDTSKWSSPATVALGDVDQDGSLDAVTAGGPSGFGEIKLALGDGAGAFPTMLVVASNTGETEATLVDVNQDGLLDIVGHDDQSTLRVRLGTASYPYFSSATSYTAVTSPLGLSVADLNIDGYPDVLLASDSPVFEVRTSSSSGSLSAATQYNPGLYSRALSTAVGDLNEDGSPDVAIGCDDGGSLNHEIMMATNDGHGVLGNAVLLQQSGITSKFPIVGIGDVGGDGIEDLLVTNGNSQGSGSTSNFTFYTNNKTVQGPWKVKGKTLPATRRPTLEGSGALLANYPLTFRIANTPKGQFGGLIWSAGQYVPPAPFKGGGMVPNLNPGVPNGIFYFTTKATGELIIPASGLSVPWPTTFYQFWYQDPAGPVGYSGTNAIQAN